MDIITEQIILPLQQAFDRKTDLPSFFILNQLEPLIYKYMEDNNYNEDLTIKLIPFYNKLVWNEDLPFIHRSFLERIINCDDSFYFMFEYCTDYIAKNFEDIIHTWEKTGRIPPVIRVFWSCGTSARKMKEDLERKLHKMEVNGDSSNFYCQLHAFVSIIDSNTSNNDKHKVELWDLFVKNIRFFDCLYSVMIRRIVGFGFHNFAQIAAYATNCKEDNFASSLQLLYAAFIERREDLIALGTKAEKLDNHLRKIKDLIKITPQKKTLNELCEILFTEDFLTRLNKHRIKSYNELVEEKNSYALELNQIRKAYDEMKKNTEDSFRVMAERLKHSLQQDVIPIDLIEKELVTDSGIGMEVFRHLHTMLAGYEPWTKRAFQIRQKIRAAREKSESQIIFGDYVGSKYVDNEVGYVESGGVGININKDKEQ